MTALVLLGHGARDPVWAEPLERVRARLARARPELAIEVAFLEFMLPTLAEAVAALVARGATCVVVVPVFLAQGVHLKRDLPALLDELRGRHSACDVRLAAAAGEAPEVIAAIVAHAAAQADGEI
ncbi:MAG: CbiX/SirB N-terminal domain-containing protein [Azoarcus sp.]|jgi:sirohydrochlorin cobaltochelatase|nr:CbiX/SirB N-terminal domain-containing protein [Azoarcus sp.]